MKGALDRLSDSYRVGYHRKGNFKQTNRRKSKLVRTLVFVLALLSLCVYYSIYGPETKTIENNIEDYYQRTVSTFNQWTSTNTPSFSGEKKLMLGRWDIDENRCLVAKEFFLAVGMRVPKAASSTLQDLVEKLASKNKYALSMVVQRHASGAVNRTEEERRLVMYLSSLDKRTVHTAHVPFLSFASLGYPRPIYFSTIRDPFKRLSSHYDYEHFGPRPLYVKLVHQNTNIPSFEECVDRHMNHRRLPKDEFDCLQTAGLQVRFYCGISDGCRRTSQNTLETAIQNIKKNFAAVVVVEQMLISFQVLEAVLPQLFKGLVSSYKETGGEVHLRSNNAAKSSGGKVSPKHLDFVMSNPALQLEYVLYNFTVARLARQASACSIRSPPFL